MKKYIYIILITLISCGATSEVNTLNRNGQTEAIQKVSEKTFEERLSAIEVNIQKLLYHNKDYSPIKESVEKVKTEQHLAKIERDDLLVQVETLKGIISNTTAEPQELKAFPTAQGFGRYATGGRGGTVYKVTNLNDSGTGSFRDACEASGARTVVFEVSGTITLSSELAINNPYLTIAGQTAPGDGICIKGASFRPRASHIIVRYIRFRPGDNGYKNSSGTIVGSNSDDIDAIGASGTAGLIENIIFDHCSMSWSIDEVIGLYGGTTGGTGINNITFQYCIFSEPLWNSHHTDGGHSMAFLMNENTQNVTVYKNLFAHGRERFIRSGGGCSFEMINNVVYNFRYACVISYDNEFTMINNHYKEGDQVIQSSYVADLTSQSGYSISDTKAYISGNTNDGGMSEIDSALTPYLLGTPLIDSGILPDTVASSITDVLTNAGAILPSRDSVDDRIVDSYNNTTGTVIDTQEQVGSYPTLSSTTALLDTDNDGISDAYEDANGLDKNDASDRNLVDSVGYTKLETYVNGIK